MRQYAGSQQAGHAVVRARQVPDGHAGDRAGAHGADHGAVHDGQRQAGFAIGQQHQRVRPRQPVAGRVGGDARDPLQPGDVEVAADVGGHRHDPPVQLLRARFVRPGDHHLRRHHHLAVGLDAERALDHIHHRGHVQAAGGDHVLLGEIQEAGIGARHLGHDTGLCVRRSSAVRAVPRSSAWRRFPTRSPVAARCWSRSRPPRSTAATCGSAPASARSPASCWGRTRRGSPRAVGDEVVIVPYLRLGRARGRAGCRRRDPRRAAPGYPRGADRRAPANLRPRPARLSLGGVGGAAAGRADGVAGAGHARRGRPAARGCWSPAPGAAPRPSSSRSPTRWAPRSWSPRRRSGRSTGRSSWAPRPACCYTDPDWPEQVGEIDIAVDSAGGPAWEGIFALPAHRRHAGQLRRTRCARWPSSTISSAVLRPVEHPRHDNGQPPRVRRAARPRRAGGLAAGGRLRATGCEDAAQAHDRMGQADRFGKVVLRVR